MQEHIDPYSIFPEPDYGSTLSVPVNGVAHPGIYVGDGFVIDNSRKRGGVRYIHMNEFRNGLKFTNHGVIGTLPPAQIVRNAHSALGKDYDFLLYNCKDFVREARGQSWQTVLIKAGVTFGVVCGGFYLARRAS